MDSSYNGNSAGVPVVSGGVSGPMPNGGAYNPFVVAGNQPSVVLAGQEKSKKKTVRNVIIVVLVLAIVIAAVVGVVMFFKTKKEALQKRTDELSSLLGWASYTGQCQSVVFNVDTTYVSAESYEGYLTQCKNDASEVKQILGDLSSANGNVDYKQYYNNLVTSVNENMIFGEDLDNMLKKYEVWHQWFLNNDGFFDAYQTAEMIEEMEKSMVECGDAAMTAFAKEWAKKATRLFEANLMTYVSSDAQYTDEYNVAYSEYDAFADTAMEVVDKVGFEVDTDKGDQLFVAMVRFKRYVQENI